MFFRISYLPIIYSFLAFNIPAFTFYLAIASVKKIIIFINKIILNELVNFYQFKKNYYYSNWCLNLTVL